MDLVQAEVVFTLQRYICQICHRLIDPSLKVPHPGAAVLDHIVPLSRGGTHSWDNVQTAHHSCNSKKGSTVLVVTKHGDDAWTVGYRG